MREPCFQEWFPAQDEGIIDTEGDVPDGVEELTRGPVHEAFANPVTGEVKPLEIIAKEPPAPIEEVPPEFKPEGDDVEWISGYWSWDEERDDFLWVSGVYRKTPPEHRWVAGYWDKVEGGWRLGFRLLGARGRSRGDLL